MGGGWERGFSVNMPQAGWAVFERSGADRLWLRPLGIVSGAAARRAIGSGLAKPLTRASLAFTLIEGVALGSDRRPVSVTAPVAELEAWLAGPGARFAQHAREQLEALSAPQAPWAGFAFDHPIVMGVLNVTPDSFSDGGLWLDPDAAIGQGRALLEAGADIIDVGGESTAPAPRRSGRARKSGGSSRWFAPSPGSAPRCRSTHGTPRSWKRRSAPGPASSTMSRR